MGALACTPTGYQDTPSEVRLGGDLLPGEKIVAFAHWPDGGGLSGESLTVYASGHLDYRKNPRTSGRKVFRFADASLGDVLRISRLLGSPAFTQADQSHGGDADEGARVASLYAPETGRAVHVVGRAERVPPSVAEAATDMDRLRAHAAETGIDPFSNLAHKVVSPILVHTVCREDEGYTQELSVFDNGALELRRVPTRLDSPVDPWATTRRIRSGTVLEVRRLVLSFDAQTDAAGHHPPGRCVHEVITARSRRRLGTVRSLADADLIDESLRLAARLDSVA